MDLARGTLWTAVAVVVLTAVVSGPLVPAVDLTRAGDEPGISFGGEDELEVSAASLPTEDVRLERGRYGAASYYLRVPSASVDVEHVRGTPRLIYKLRVPELGYVRSTIHFVDRAREGSRMTLALEETTVDADRIEREAYDGELLLVARTDDTAETVARSNVTVEVRS